MNNPLSKPCQIKAMTFHDTPDSDKVKDITLCGTARIGKVFGQKISYMM